MSWFLVLLARNTGYSVRVNHKVSTTAAASNKQGDVALVNFGLVGSNHFAIDVSICCVDHIGNNGHLYGKMHTNVYVHALAGAKNRKYKKTTLLLVRSLHLQLCQWLDKFIPSFFVSCGSWLTNRRAITIR